MPNTATLPQDTGPYSTLFDYKEEAVQEEARKVKLQESQQKIMRTNAIGDAFRLLLDGVGGSQGAVITPKTVNPSILNASNKYANTQTSSDTRMDRLKLTAMTNKGRDLQYRQGLEAEKQKRVDEAALYQQKMGYENAKSENDYKRKRADELTDQKTTQANRLTAQDNSAKNTRETQAEYQKNLLASFNRKRDRSIRTAKEDVEFIIPGTAEHIYISPAEILEMQSELIGDKSKYDPTLDAALKDLMRNDPIKLESGLLTLKKNWERVKGVLGYPDGTVPGLPAQPATEEAGTLAPEEATFIQNVSASTKHTPEQKRKAVYQYLLKQGYDDTSSKAFAEDYYKNLNIK